MTTQIPLGLRLCGGCGYPLEPDEEDRCGPCAYAHRNGGRGSPSYHHLVRDFAANGEKWRPQGVSDKLKIPLQDARKIANKAASLLEQYCERIAVAGSIRRQVDLVGDVELVCIPRSDTPGFGRPSATDHLSEYLKAACDSKTFGWDFRLNIRGQKQFGPMNKLVMFTGFAVDVFTTSERNWGMAMFVRTGPKEWNVAAMERFRSLGMLGHAYGGVTMFEGPPERRKPIEVGCPQEEGVFQILKWPWVEPAERTNERLVELVG